MLSFFYRGHRFILSIFVVCLIVLICFFAAGKNVFPKSALVDEVSYQVGNPSYKRYVKRAEIDAMKAFLSLDLGMDLMMYYKGKMFLVRDFL